MEGGKVLARYEQSAREFLYPTPTLTGKDGVERELLLGRTVHFTVSLIQACITKQFCKTVIHQNLTPLVSYCIQLI